MPVLPMIRAIHTTVHTIIGKIQRGKKNDTVAIKILFDESDEFALYAYVKRSEEALPTV